MGTNISIKDEIRQLAQQCEKLKENLHGVQKEVEKKEKEDDILKKDEMKTQSEKAELIPKVREEEENLKLKLKLVRAKLGSLTKDSVGVRRDLKDKEIQLENAQRDHSQTLQELEDVKKDAKEAL